MKDYEKIFGYYFWNNGAKSNCDVCGKGLRRQKDICLCCLVWFSNVKGNFKTYLAVGKQLKVAIARKVKQFA